MLAKDVMKKDVVSVAPDATVEEVARLMVEKGVSGLPVVDEEQIVVGVVSELDLMRKEIRPDEPGVWRICVWSLGNEKKLDDYRDAVRKYMAQTAGEIMTSPAITVHANDSLEIVGNLMFEKNIKRVIVTENGKLAGLISRSVFTELLLEKRPV